MEGTRHCCWGECKTDSRYPEKWPESLKELEKSGQKVFIPFPKPAKDLANVQALVSVMFTGILYGEKRQQKHVHL